MRTAAWLCGKRVLLTVLRPLGPEHNVALEAAGLPADAAREPIAIEVKPTYIDLEHLSDALRVHKGASGSTYVLQRVEDIPFVFS